MKFLARIYLLKLLIEAPLPQSSRYIHKEADLMLTNTHPMVEIDDPTKKYNFDFPIRDPTNLPVRRKKKQKNPTSASLEGHDPVE